MWEHQGRSLQKTPPYVPKSPETKGGGFLWSLSGSQIFGFRDLFWDGFTSRNRCFGGAKTQIFLAAEGGRKFCSFLMVLPLEIAQSELKNPKFSGRRRRPKILTLWSRSQKSELRKQGGFTGVIFPDTRTTRGERSAFGRFSELKIHSHGRW